nr:unnamed protein product [Callosobruchus analis]
MNEKLDLRSSTNASKDTSQEGDSSGISLNNTEHKNKSYQKRKLIKKEVKRTSNKNLEKKSHILKRSTYFGFTIYHITHTSKFLYDVNPGLCFDSQRYEPRDKLITFLMTCAHERREKHEQAAEVNQYEHTERDVVLGGRLEYLRDPGEWPQLLTTKIVDSIIEIGPVQPPASFKFPVGDKTETVIAKEITQETVRNPVMSKELQWTRKGWPEQTNRFLEAFQPYLRRRNEISEYQDCLLWGARDPTTRRKGIMNLLHERYPGVRPSQPNTNVQRTIRPNPNYNPQHRFGHAQTSETQLCDSNESSEEEYFDASCYSQASCEQTCDPNYWEPNLDFRNDPSHDEPPPLTLFEDMSEMEMDESLKMSEHEDHEYWDGYDSDKDAEYIPPDKKPPHQNVRIKIRGKMINIPPPPPESVDTSDSISSSTSRSEQIGNTQDERHAFEERTDREINVDLKRSGEVFQHDSKPKEDTSMEVEQSEGDSALHQEDSTAVEDTVQAEAEMSDVVVQENDEKVDRSRKKLSRIRQRNPEQWKCNLRKENFDRGREYISVRKKRVPARMIRTSKDCVSKCIYQCARKISETQREDIFSHYYMLTAQEKKCLYSTRQ